MGPAEDQPAAPLAPLLEESAEDLYENAPCGYLSTLGDGTIVKVNQTFLSWTGHAREDLLAGRHFQDLLSPGGRIYHETHYAPLLAMQGAVREIALEIVRADGTRLPVLVNSVLRHDATGRPAVVRTTVFDARDRKAYERELLRAREREREARERTERLQRLTAALAATTSATGAVRAVLDELVAGPEADRALVGLLGGEDEAPELHVAGTGPRPDAAPPVPGEPAFAEVPGSREEAVGVLPLVAGRRTLGVLWVGCPEPRAYAEAERAFLLAAAGQCAQAVERARLYEQTVRGAGHAVLLARLGRALDEVPGQAARLRRLLEGLVGEVADGGHVEPAGRPAADAPGPVARAIATGRPQLDQGGRRIALSLRARDTDLGTLVLVRDEGRPPFDAAEVVFLGDVAERAGLALENARLYEHERDVAHTLQQSLLAVEPPRDARLEVTARYLPAEEELAVGGDWHDAFTLGDDRIAVVVGDVVGRGLDAATAMGQLRSAIRALAGESVGPARLLERLDVFADRTRGAQMATVAYAELDLASGRLTYACAGHPPPVVVAHGGAAHMLWEGRSAPLGNFGLLLARRQAETVLASGARLLLYTDGLVERRTRRLSDQLDRLVAEAGRRWDVPLEAFADELSTTMLADEPSRDDVCLLCVARRDG